MFTEWVPWPLTSQSRRRMPRLRREAAFAKKGEAAGVTGGTAPTAISSGGPGMGGIG